MVHALTAAVLSVHHPPCDVEQRFYRVRLGLLSARQSGVGVIGGLMLRRCQGYVYTGAGGKTVTVYLRHPALAHACNEEPALRCVDVVAFEL